MSKLVTVQEQSLMPYEFAHDIKRAVTTVADRLREAMELRDVDQSALAKAIGVTQGTISLILQGKTRQSKYLPDIAIELGVAYDWLIGRHDNRDADSPVEALLTPTEHDVIGIFRALPPMDSFAARRVVSALAATSENTRFVELPPEYALARMFQGMLRVLPPNAGEAEHAALLAKRLPIALAQIRDLAPVAEHHTQQAERETVEALSTPDRG